MTRSERARRAKLHEFHAKPFMELRPYHDGESEFVAMIGILDKCIDLVDQLLNHPSVVLDELRYQAAYEARRSLTIMRLALSRQPTTLFQSRDMPDME